MKKRALVLTILCLILSMTVIAKAFFLHNFTSGFRYFFWATFWISAIMIVILTANLILSMGKKQDQARMERPKPDEENRRRSYRVTYPPQNRPVLYIDTVDAQSKRQLEYVVIDISEEGLCFMDDGSLGTAETIIGRLQFTDGATHAITGEIVRRRQNRISVRLIQSLAWSTLLNEQRLIMSSANNGDRQR